MGFSILGMKVFACQFLPLAMINIKSMIGNQDLLGLTLFGYLLVASSFSKKANQVKVATALFILGDKFEFNDSSSCVPKSAG